jgi:predicted SAM-dependent methyltransferase
MHRLNWGCGPIAPYGWMNSDINPWPGVDVVADIRAGLPLPEGGFDYIVSIHALGDLPYVALDPAVGELRRVLRKGGVLRLGLPDLDKEIAEYVAKDADYFTTELLARNGYHTIRTCSFRETAGEHPSITELDNRPHESFFIEAIK